MARVELAALSVDYFCEDVVIIRRSGETVVKGERIPNAETRLTIRANVQPLSGKDLKQLAEHERVEGIRRITTREVLNVAGHAGATYSDMVEYHGQLYKLTIFGDRYKGAFYKYFATLDDGYRA